MRVLLHKIKSTKLVEKKCITPAVIVKLELYYFI